jgi:membrane fusion protein (multidrug efflux system)
MWKRMLLMLFCVALALAGIGYAKFRQIQAAIAMGKSFAPPPSAVTTLILSPQRWEPVVKIIGTLKAVQGVTVSTDLAGIISEIGFESGVSVKKGTLLVQLNSDSEHAQLAAAQVRRDLAVLEVKRKRELLAKNALSASETDAAEAEVRQSEAACAQAAALLARKRITAPFDGVLGLRQVNLGQFLNPGSPVVSLQALDPIRVQFNLPQQEIGAAALEKKVRVSAQEVPGGPREGKVSALDSQVDEASRAISVEATLANPDQALRPGMFVTVELPLDVEPEVLVIPASAVNYAPYGDSVYVVLDGTDSEGKPAKTVDQRFVKLGQNRGDQIRVLAGLKAGDEVVTSGVFKLRQGAAVVLNNSVQPSNSPAPTPPNN